MASCVENNERVCYAGKATRMLRVLQGVVKDISIDVLDVDALPEVAPEQLLSSVAGEELATIEEPTLGQALKFIGRAVAASELRWPTANSPQRAVFLQHLREYCNMDFRDYTDQLPELT